MKMRIIKSKGLKVKQKKNGELYINIHEKKKKNETSSISFSLFYNKLFSVFVFFNLFIYLLLLLFVYFILLQFFFYVLI